MSQMSTHRGKFPNFNTSDQLSNLFDSKLINFSLSSCPCKLLMECMLLKHKCNFSNDKNILDVSKICNRRKQYILNA